MKYINSYNSVEEANAGVNFSPNVSLIENQLVLTDVGEDKPIEFVKDGNTISGRRIWEPLTFKGVAEENSVQLKWTVIVGSPSIPSIDLEVSINGEDWRPYEITDGTGEIIALSANDTVKFRGDNETLGNLVSYPVASWKYLMTGQLEASGNILSLLDKECAITSVPAAAFYHLFNKCSSLTTAPELPATELADYCYSYMFSDCTSLIIAPELPATILAPNCYDTMFSGCISLTVVPALPAISLASTCYQRMFSGCTSLTTAPELPAMTLAQSCYLGMFNECTSLTEAPELPATTLSAYCYSNMFNACSSLITPPALTATTLTETCYSYMFQGCTSLTTTPELPATTLAANCYNGMFRGCTSLTTTPELPATELVDSCYYLMFSDCISITELTVYANNISATDCIERWLDNTAQGTTGTLYSLGSADFTGLVPENWTIIAPLRTPLNFTAEENNSTVTLEMHRVLDTSYEYSRDNITWSPYTIGDTITLTNVGDEVYFRGDNSEALFTDGDYMHFELSGRVAAAGNIMSILDKTMKSTSVPEFSMFCLFASCTSLTTAPELPATILADNCYNSMFYNCTSLTTAPELPATTLADGCYRDMFNGCTALTELTVHADDISATYCLSDWLDSTASDTTGTLHSLGSADFTGEVPDNWTISTTPQA